MPSHAALGCAAALTLLAGCATAPARMVYRQLDSRAMGHPMSYGLYAPPGFAPGEHLPLVVFLHGGGDDVTCLEEEGIVAYLDGEIGAGRLPRVLVLVPQGDRGFWANWADGTHRYEDWVLREAMPSAMRAWGAQRCPAGCHLLGISMGANGALRFALAHPGLFGSAALLSGPMLDAQGMEWMLQSWFLRTFSRLDRVFGASPDPRRTWRADPFQRWRSPDDLAGLRLFFAHGDDDRQGIAETNAALHQHLEANGVPHRYLVFHGGHRWADWEPVIGEAIRAALAPAGPAQGPTSAPR